MTFYKETENPSGETILYVFNEWVTVPEPKGNINFYLTHNKSINL